MVVGQWYFFAIVLDGISKQGLIQIDYAYGYSNGTTDFKVFSSLKFSNIYIASQIFIALSMAEAKTTRSYFLGLMFISIKIIFIFNFPYF